MPNHPALKVIAAHEPQQDVIGLLREMLDRAEKGQLRAVAIAAHELPDCTGTAYAIGDGDIAHLVCSLERVKLRLLNID